MSDLNNCDCCGKIEPSIDLFWNVSWGEHTKKQLKAIDAMQKAGFDAICSECFYKLTQGDL